VIDGVQGIGGAAAPQTQQQPAASPAGAAFGDLLAQKLGQAGQAGQSQPLNYSGHALERIRQRGIAVDEARLGEGVDRAAAKGARTTLVLIDQAAFVVAAQNRTVITAVDREHMREQVFTNIDSAVIA
jgi:flagellar operon protein